MLRCYIIRRVVYVFVILVPFHISSACVVVLPIGTPIVPNVTHVEPYAQRYRPNIESDFLYIDEIMALN